MKMAYKYFSSLIETSPGYPTGLVLEQADMYYRFLLDLKYSLEGEERGIVFSEDNKLLNPSKSVKLLVDFINFDLNQKILLTKILHEMEERAVEERFYRRSQEILGEIENHIDALTLDFSCDLSLEKLSFQSLLKAIGVSIVDDHETLEEKLLAYMDLVWEFEGKRLFVFVNLRCLIPQDRFQKMIDTALLREHEILLIDTMEFPKLNREVRIIIDEDLCEI